MDINNGVTFYVLLNWFLCILTSISLLITLLKARYLIVKPSIMVLLYFHFMCQWSTTIYSGFIEHYLPSPYEFTLLVHGFELVGLFVCIFTVRKNSLTIWKRITSPEYLIKGVNSKAIFILLSVMAIIVTYYFFYVPFDKTGIYAIFTASDARYTATVREESLKLLDNQILQYLYHFNLSIFGPLLVAMLALFIRHNLLKRKILKPILAILGIACIMFVVSLTGARAYIGNMLLVIMFTIYLRKGVPIKPATFVVMFILITIPSVLLTILREGETVSIENVIIYFLTGTFSRIFVTPMKVGLWHVHYAQTEGYLGIAGIPKLAFLLNIEPIDVPNLIATQYALGALESATANTSFVFSYYSYFGLLSFPFCLIGLWMLDIAILFYKKMSNTTLLPTIAAISLSAMTFAATNYTIALITHGFLMLLLLSLFLDHLMRITLSMPAKRYVR